jgi:Flp pilus assembly protein TadG
VAIGVAILRLEWFRRRRNGGNRDRGAALIELAFALPLILMLVVGIATAGAAYNTQLALTHSAREAGRYGATLPVTNFGSMNAWLDEVAARAVTDATGSLNPGTPGLEICVAYVHPDGLVSTDQTASRTNTGGTVTYGNGVCYPDDRPNGERRVQVEVKRNANFSVVFWSSVLTLDSDGTSRFEAAGGL